MTEFVATVDAPADLDMFTRAYLEAAEFADCGPDHEAHGAEWSAEFVAQAVKDCAAFQNDNAATLASVESLRAGRAEVTVAAGHDFWFTRNGHGAGFWDGDWPEPAASVLTAASKRFGQIDLYLGDDGLIYGA